MHAITLVANSTLLNYIRRDYPTVLQASIVGMVLNEQEKADRTIYGLTKRQRDTERWWGERGGGGFFDLSGKRRLVFQQFFIGCMKRCCHPLP